MPQDNFLKWWRIGLIAFGLVFIVSGGGFYAWTSARSAAAVDWPRAEGEVVRSGVETVWSSSSSSSGGRSRSYAPLIVYRYGVNGTVYEGRQIWLNESQSFGFASSARAFAAQYPVGRRVSVIYNPEAPSDAALINEGAPWWLWLFVVVGLAIAVAGWFVPRIFGDLPPLRKPVYRNLP